MTAEKSRSKNQEWDERTLCSDEACIGIIGPNGRCNECGRPYAGKPTGADGAGEDDLALAPETLLDETDEDADNDDGGSDDALEEDDLAIDGDSHWENRILCRDESCIGVIGPDGRCKECGKPLEADAD
jgi:hypothetical protein